MSTFRRLRRPLGIVLFLFLLYFGVLAVHGAWTDWQPEGTTPLTVEHPPAQTVIADSIISLANWNVGYGGLGAESDLFYDDAGMWYSGSSMIRSPLELVQKNLEGAVTFLKNNRADFFLLQEVDVASKRSYDLPQYQRYQEALPNFAATMAINYHCDRVPIPLLEPWHPYGHVLSGLATLSRFQPTEATRHQLPGHYPMPDRMFQLDRCAALHRFPTSRGKDLVVINLHNAAYDPGDKIKAIQLPYLRDLALREYQKGNYVILGGDWNQCPPNFRFDTFMPGQTQGYVQGNIPFDFFPDTWQYAYDPTVPTNRKASDPYVKGETFETLIDFFLISPNLTVRSIRGIPQDFQFSDHQPVWVEIQLQ
ncbi:MAG: endonuclease/exonuclease/phosphatase family protein [Saprospiraceae bacterium]|nr:endonuclease/exonuclease/phosphatase family protein [Saprospiraceae bacterium]